VLEEHGDVLGSGCRECCDFWDILRPSRKRLRELQIEKHSISAEELHALLASDQEVFVFDVRQPLDLLAYPENDSHG
jgi:hypothetical protein